jgi:peptidoglycan/LPS O-acetylase OafA/YrhL
MFLAPFLVAAYVVLSHLGIGTPVQLRNAVLVGLGYTMMGMLIRRFEKKILGSKAAAPVLWIVFVICCVTAIVELNGYKQGIAVPFVSCEILVYVIALLCLKYPDFGKGTFAEWLGHECSLPVYIIHMAVLQLIIMTGNDGFFGKYGAVTVFVTATVIAALYMKIKTAVTDRKQ